MGMALRVEFLKADGTPRYKRPGFHERESLALLDRLTDRLFARGLFDVSMALRHRTRLSFSQTAFRAERQPIDQSR